MEVVRAGFEDEIHSAATAPSKARIGYGSLLTKLLHGVQRREQDNTQTIVVLGITDPIEQEVVLFQPQTVNGIAGASAYGAQCDGARDLRLRRGHARR